MPAAEDLTGQKFGRLTVLSLSPQRQSGRRVWNCLCDCGAQVKVLACHLKSGHTQSCGCFQKEHAAMVREKIGGHHIGEIAKNWELVRRTDKKATNQGIIWVAKCIYCGKEREILGSYFGGKQRDLPICSCMKSSSKGEELICELLEKNNIPYERQASFPDLVDKKRLRFDFKLNDGTLIEYDGIQHFKYRNSGWNTKENYLQIVKRDKMKNEYCLKNNIPLIRIPYTHYQDLCLEDLLKDTSIFLIGKEGYV